MTLTDYVSRKEGKGLTSIDDSVDTLIEQLEDYIEKCRERLMTATKNQYRQHEDQQNRNNQKTKMRRKNNPVDVLSN